MKKLKSFWEGVADAFSFSMMLIVALMLLTLLLAGCTSAVIDAPAASNRSDVIAELNRYRMGHDLEAVTTNPRVGELADHRARHAWQYRNSGLSKGHRLFNEDVIASGIPGKWYGENLYKGPVPSYAREMVQMWHDSPPHRRLMQRRTMDWCNAGQTNDGKQTVVALICVDHQSGERI
jgi:uncharacterized protein YkwD